jgi:hypothetical protein
MGTDALTGETVLIVNNVKAGYYNLFQYKTGVGCGDGTEEAFKLQTKYRLMDETASGQPQWMLKVDRPGTGGVGSKTLFLIFQDNCVAGLSTGNVWVKKFGSYLYTWHELKICANFATGQAEIYVDNMDTPVLSYVMYSGSTASANSVVFGDGSGTIGGKVAISEFKWSNHVPVLCFSGDANNDGLVDVGDLGILAANYGGSNKGWAQGDFNGDGLVDVGDLGILAAHYGEGASSSTNFAADYTQIFGASVVEDDASTEESGSLCSSLGLPMLAGFLLMAFLRIKLEE